MSEKLLPVMEAFYTWFHARGRSGVLIEHEREAFLAGWEASENYRRDENVPPKLTVDEPSIMVRDSRAKRTYTGH